MENILNKIDFFIDSIALKLEKHQITVPINIVGAILFITLSGILLILMPSQIKINTDSSVNARTFPLLMLRIMFVFSLLLFAKDIISLLRKQPIEMKTINLLTEVRALIIFLTMLFFVVMMYYTNFILSAALFGILMLFYFRAKKLSSYILIVISAILIGIFFQQILHVRLP